jgi:hypothetical protein
LPGERGGGVRDVRLVPSLINNVDRAVLAIDSTEKAGSARADGNAVAVDLTRLVVVRSLDFSASRIGSDRAAERAFRPRLVRIAGTRGTNERARVGTKRANALPRCRGARGWPGAIWGRAGRAYNAGRLAVPSPAPAVAVGRAAGVGGRRVATVRALGTAGARALGQVGAARHLLPGPGQALAVRCATRDAPRAELHARARAAEFATARAVGRAAARGSSDDETCPSRQAQSERGATSHPAQQSTMRARRNPRFLQENRRPGCATPYGTLIEESVSRRPDGASTIRARRAFSPAHTSGNAPGERGAGCHGFLGALARSRGERAECRSARSDMTLRLHQGRALLACERVWV